MIYPYNAHCPGPTQSSATPSARTSLSAVLFDLTGEGSVALTWSTGVIVAATEKGEQSGRDGNWLRG